MPRISFFRHLWQKCDTRKIIPTASKYDSLPVKQGALVLIDDLTFRPYQTHSFLFDQTISGVCWRLDSTL